MECSVTAWDYYMSVNGVYTLKYGGGTSCAGHVGQRTLNVVPQVFNLVHGTPLWFNIGGAGLFQGPTPAGPLRLNGTRMGVTGHLYRLLAYGQVVLPNGRLGSVTVCADCQRTRPILSIAPPPGFTYTWSSVAVKLPGLSKGPDPGSNYYTVTGSTLSATTTTAPFLALNTGRTVYIGHPYRVVAVGTVTRSGRTTTSTAHSLTAGP
jgi:hypothetical protein